MSFAPGILAALFGVPPLKAVAALKPPETPVEKKDETGAETSKPTDSLLKEMWGVLKKGVKDDPDNRLRIMMVASLIIAWLLFGAIIFMSLILYIMIQRILYKNSKRTAEQAIEESKKPYMDTLEYQVMDPSIFTKYPYRALFYLSAVAFTLMILAYLFKIQLAQNANPGGVASGDDDDKPENPIDNAVKIGSIVSLYLFFACYWVVEKSYYTKIVDYIAKITDFNQFVRSILPGNYQFLNVVSKPSSETTLDNTVYTPALEALNPNKREIVRGLCILNLYTYYHEQRGNYTRPGGVSNVLECFNPINRILPTAPSCFSDHLIHNNSFINNRVGKYIALLEAMPASTGAAATFRANRTQILLDLDKMMNELNQRGSCLGSTTAYNKFLTMNTRVFLLVWIPLVFAIFTKSSSYFKKK
jgi:hypothetical protein